MMSLSLFAQQGSKTKASKKLYDDINKSYIKLKDKWLKEYIKVEKDLFEKF